MGSLLFLCLRVLRENVMIDKVFRAELIIRARKNQANNSRETINRGTVNADNIKINYSQNKAVYL